jgi:hypothetical protein
LEVLAGKNATLSKTIKLPLKLGILISFTFTCSKRFFEPFFFAIVYLFFLEKNSFK